MCQITLQSPMLQITCMWSASLCIECCSVEIKTNIVDMLEFNTYEEQELDSDPVIFLQCGHFYSRTTLDGIMEIGESSSPKKSLKFYTY